MAITVLEIGLTVCLGILVYEDFKAREVSVWLYPVLGVLSIGRTVLVYDSVFWKSDLPMNVMVWCLFIGGIYLFGYVRKCAIKELIGAGDVWFMFVLTLFFPFKEFILFMNGSLLVALVWGIFLNRKDEIPLVGIQAFCFILFLIIA